VPTSTDPNVLQNKKFFSWIITELIVFLDANDFLSDVWFGSARIRMTRRIWIRMAGGIQIMIHMRCGWSEPDPHCHSDPDITGFFLSVVNMFFDCFILHLLLMSGVAPLLEPPFFTGQSPNGLVPLFLEIFAFFRCSQGGVTLWFFLKKS